MTRLKLFALLMLSLTMLVYTRGDERVSDNVMPLQHDVARWGSASPPPGLGLEQALVALLSEQQGPQARRR